MNKLLAWFGFSFMAITALAWNEADLVAHFPFDGDCLSTANAELNAARTIPFKPENIDFSGDVKAPYVHDRTGGAPYANTKSLHLKMPSSLTIDLSRFGLGSDCKRLTCEFFIKARGLPTWTFLARLGLANTLTAETGAPSFSNPSMFYLQTNGGGQLYGAAFNQDGVMSGSNIASVNGTYTKSTLVDERWHHAVIVIDGSTAGKIRTWMMLDYATATELTPLTTAGWRGQDVSSGKSLYLQLGTNNTGKNAGEFWIDEMKIFAGINASKVVSTSTAPYACFWTRQIPTSELWENIASGTALLYCPYDQSFNTTVYENWPVQSISGSKYYCEPKDLMRGAGRQIWTYDRQTKIRGENMSALTNSSSIIEAGMYAMRSPNFKSGTIEWLMRCSENYPEFTRESTLKDYKTLFGMFGSSQPYSFLTQLTSTNNADKVRRYYIRLDCTKLIDGHTPNAANRESFQSHVPVTKAGWNDAKWHHCAVTIAEPDAVTGRQTIEFFLDYARITTWQSTDYIWDGFLPDELLRQNNGVWIDELRISKGVLPVAKFLRPYNLMGMCIVVR